MIVASSPQLSVVRLGAWIMHRGALTPIECGVEQTLITRVAANYVARLPTGLGHRRASAQCSQGVKISVAQCVAGLGEHSGANEIPDTWQGEEDFSVTRLTFGAILAQGDPLGLVF